MHYQVIESKLNHMSLEELEMHDPNTFGVITNKLLHIALNPTKSQLNAIQSIATKLGNMDAVNSSNHVKGKFITYSQSRSQWIAYRTINGKRKVIKSGKDKKVVQDAYLNFCIKNDIKP